MCSGVDVLATDGVIFDTLGAVHVEFKTEFGVPLKVDSGIMNITRPSITYNNLSLTVACYYYFLPAAPSHPHATNGGTYVDGAVRR